MTHTLILLRHGESEWNAKNLFTGWVDVGPHRQGPRRGRARRRAHPGGRAARPTSCTPPCSAARSTPPAWPSTPPTGTGSRCRRSWRLNERHYGALQGKDKKQTLEEYGEEQFMLWRRSFDVPPPPLDDDDEFSQVGDPQYADLGDEMPRTECLKDVIARFLPYWESDIVPGPAGREDRAGRRPRQQPAGAGQAPRRHQRRGHRRPQHPDRHAAGLPARRRAAPTVRGGEYLDPEAAAAAAAAVANQGR